MKLEAPARDNSAAPSYFIGVPRWPTCSYNGDMFRIKICGVTSTTDARNAAAAGADAIGLNFFPASKRYLPPEAAKEVAAAIPRGVLKVGVFVNAPAEFVCRESDRLRLDLIQLAGHETPKYLAKLDGRTVMQVFRQQADRQVDFIAIREFLNEAKKLGCMPKLALVDTHTPGLFGGTGKTLNWAGVSGLWQLCSSAVRLCPTPPPLVLAGGLAPENILAAIQTVRPWAVDVASGVESSPGVKDPLKMRQFISAALAGFHNYPPLPLQPQASSLKPQAP